jgi:cell wall-associated NlpC family hydrolase
VAHVLPTHYGKSVPAFCLQYCATEMASIAQLIDTSRPLVPTLKVEVPEPGDIVLLSFAGHTCHVAVYVGEGLVLHALPKVGTVLERLEGVRLGRRLEGFYRVL